MAYTLPAVAVDPSIVPIAISGSSKPLMPLAMGGGAWFIGHTTLLAALEMHCAGIRHFDTGAGYGEGESEKLFARFQAGRRDEQYVASKADPPETTAPAVLADAEESLRGLQTDSVLGIHQERLAIGNGTVDVHLTRRRTFTSLGAQHVVWATCGSQTIAVRAGIDAAWPTEGAMISPGFASSSASLFDAATGARI